jgi:predicted acetyltransferase
LNESESEGLSLDINTLSAMLFGYKRPADLYEIGQIEGGEEAIKGLETLIPARKAFFYDFF